MKITHDEAREALSDLMKTDDSLYRAQCADSLANYIKQYELAEQDQAADEWIRGEGGELTRSIAEAEIARLREQVDEMRDRAVCHRRRHDDRYAHGSAALCVACENALRTEIARLRAEVERIEAARKDGE